MENDSGEERMLDPETLPRKIRKAAHIYKRKDYPLGPMEHLNKKQNVHRDYLLPRMQSRFEFFAKKLREDYINEGTIAGHKAIVESERLRLQTDTLEFLRK